MACFITPLIAGIAVSLLKKLWKEHEKVKLGVLELMLIGGALVLMVEHVWHGEVIPYPPFLTAMKSSADISIMLHEMSVVGGSMTLAVTALWLGILYASKRLEIKVTPVKQVTTTLKYTKGR